MHERGHASPQIEFPAKTWKKIVLNLLKDCRKLETVHRSRQGPSIHRVEPCQTHAEQISTDEIVLIIYLPIKQQNGCVCVLCEPWSQVKRHCPECFLHMYSVRVAEYFVIDTHVRVAARLSFDLLLNSVLNLIKN